MVRVHASHRYLCASFRSVLLNDMCAIASSDDSCVSTASSSDEVFAHNIWKPITERFFSVLVGGIFVLFVDEIEPARIALSCRFVLDLLCDKEGAHVSS